MQLQNFLHMGAYGGYVWSAYGLTGAVMLWNAFSAWRRHRLLIRELRLRHGGGHRA